MATISALVVQPGTDQAQRIDIDPSDYTALQRILGGYVEAVRLAVTDGYALVDEEGTLRDAAYNLPPSVLASRRLVGTVVLVGPAVRGDLTSVTPELEALAREVGLTITEKES